MSLALACERAGGVVEGLSELSHSCCSRGWGREGMLAAGGRVGRGSQWVLPWTWCLWEVFETFNRLLRGVCTGLALQRRGVSWSGDLGVTSLPSEGAEGTAWMTAPWESVCNERKRALSREREARKGRTRASEEPRVEGIPLRCQIQPCFMTNATLWVCEMWPVTVRPVTWKSTLRRSFCTEPSGTSQASQWTSCVHLVYAHVLTRLIQVPHLCRV